MKKLIAFTVLTLIGANAVMAQYTPVTFDYEKSSFNETLPLPAEKNFMLKGQVSPVIDMVKLTVWRNNNHKEGNRLHTAEWRRSFDNQSQYFDLPVNYKLRGNAEYDMQIDYLRRITDAEKEVLKTSLNSLLDAYLKSNIDADRNDMDLRKPAGTMIQDMNDIVNEGLINYNNLVGYEFKGFSDIVKDKLNQVDDARMRDGKFSIVKSQDGVESNRDAKNLYGQNLISELQDIVHGELLQLMSTDMVVVADTKMIRDYPTESTMNTLPINIGYGAVYFSGKFNNLNYGAAPYVGLSLPLGNATFSKFFGNASLSTGIFLKNIEDQTSPTPRTFTGPFVKKPIYVALGYKFFRFIRFNAGVTALENRNLTIQNIGSVQFKDITVRPFVGLSAEIDIWAGIKNRK